MLLYEIFCMLSFSKFSVLEVIELIIVEQNHFKTGDEREGK